MRVKITIDLETADADFSRALRVIEGLKHPAEAAQPAASQAGELMVLEAFAAAGPAGLDYNRIYELNRRAFPDKPKTATPFYRKSAGLLERREATATESARQAITPAGIARLNQLRAEAAEVAAA